MAQTFLNLSDDYDLHYASLEDYKRLNPNSVFEIIEEDSVKALIVEISPDGIRRVVAIEKSF